MCDDDKVNRDEESREVLELVSNSSLVDLEEFLSNEKSCLHLDENQLFSEINRLASLNESKYESEDEDRTIEELLKEAETLINQPIGENPAQLTSISCESTPLEIRHNLLDRYDYSTVMNTNNSCSQNDVSLSRVYKLNFFFLLYISQARPTAFAITLINAIISFPACRISLAGSKKPCRPVSRISTVYEYFIFNTPLAQSSLPPAAG